MTGNTHCWVGCLWLVTGLVHAADAPVSLDPAFEQQSRARLAALRQQIGGLQQEVRELEELLNDSSQILVQIQLLEVDAADARKVGLPVPDNSGQSAAQTVAQADSNEQNPWRLLPPEKAAAIIDRLRTQGGVQTLGSSSLVTVDGREGAVWSGGEFPILVPQSKKSVNTEWKDFGLRAEVTPTILDSGRVRVSFSLSVSERDFAHAVKMNDMTVPGITTRRVSSAPEMDFEETFVMCALASRKQQHAQATGLNKVPYVNRLVKPASLEEESTESAFVVFVTPSLVPRTK